MAKIEPVLDAGDFVTQVEAARLRGVSLASINELVRRGRLVPIEMFGRKVLRRADVMSFTPMKTGPKPGRKKPVSKRKRAMKK